MTSTQWATLRRGDVIMERRSKALRRILSVSPPAGPCGRIGITLRKLRQGAWTPKTTTTYFNTDDRGRWSLVSRRIAAGRERI